MAFSKVPAKLDQDVEYSPYAMKVASSPAAADVSPRAARRHRGANIRLDQATGEAGNGVFEGPCKA